MPEAEGSFEQWTPLLVPNKKWEDLGRAACAICGETVTTSGLAHLRAMQKKGREDLHYGVQYIVVGGQVKIKSS